MRYYKNQWYIGRKTQQKNSFGEWEYKPLVKVFQGKPYNESEFDTIFPLSYPILKEMRLSWRDCTKLIEEPLEELIAKKVNFISINH